MAELPPLLYAGPRAALLRRLAELRQSDLVLLDAAIRELAGEKRLRNRVDRGFWFAWYEGPRLDSRHETEIKELFTDVVVAVATGVAQLDVARFAAGLRPQPQGLGGILGGIGGWLGGNSRRGLDNVAIRIIEDAVAPWDPRLGVLAAWNASCAVALRRILDPPVEEILAGPWRKALGDLPA
jgi:hypothetical protein